MKTYYYNLHDHSWDEMRWVMCVDEEMQLVDVERTIVDNHVRIPEDWDVMIMPIEVWKAYINVILGYKDLTPKRINIWQSYYQDYRNEWNANGFVKVKVEGEEVVIESLNKHWECQLRIHI